ncbi:hypothetical protein ACNRWW_01560 [Metabacillus sp. HB246100]
MKLLLGLIGIFILSGCTGSKEEQKVLDNYESYFKNHLQTKYERSFEIKEITKGAKYLGGPILVSAEMFPSDEEELIFSVSAAVESEMELTENYLANKWKREAGELVQNQMKTIFNNDVWYEFSFSVKENLLNQEVIDKQEQKLSYALKEYNDQIFPYIQIVDIEKNVDSAKKLTELYDFISFLHESNLQNTGISLETYSTDFKDKIKANPRKFLELGFTDRVYYQQDGTIIFSFSLQDSDTALIKSKDDLSRIYNKDQ